MEMIRVSSRDVESIGYSNNVLCVRFLSGGTYEYYNVPYDIYLAFMSASSKGGFVHKFLKNYPYRRIN